MQIPILEFNGVRLFYTQVYQDNRGYFCQLYNSNEFNIKIAQENISFSKTGTLRGLHFQWPWQGKLLCVLQGSIHDVIVDLRKHSSTFMDYGYINLSSRNHSQLYIPEGFAHGFLALEDSMILYKCTSHYNKANEHCIRYDDEELDIQWPTLPRKDFIISEKDKNGMPFKQALKCL